MKASCEGEMTGVKVENFVDEFNMWMRAVQCELQEKSMRSINPQKRFVNAFYYMTQYLFLHNLEYIEFKVEKYQAPKPFEFIEMFKNILVNDNERILLHLKKCKEKAQKDICELQTFVRDYVSGDVIAYRQENLDSKEKILEAIGIVADELKAFELEISLRESENVPNDSVSNYSQTCDAIQSLERLIEAMKEYQ